MRFLIERLNSLCEFLDNSFGINCGACCLIASYIAKHLDNLDITYNLIIFDSDDRDEDSVISEIRNNKRDINGNSVVGLNTCSHYCIEIEDDIINRGEKYDDDYYKFRIPNIKYKDIEWIYKKGDWNDRFNTYYCDCIKGIINNFFSIYENKIDELE